MNEFIREINTIKPAKLFFIDNPIELCRLPYPGHEKGCPNIGKNKKCPPFAKKIKDVYDLSKPYFLCYVKFSLYLQKQKMKFNNPDWSERRCKCNLYWQKSVVKELKKKSSNFVIHKYIETTDYYDYELIPEAMGLNVFETMENCGITLEKNPGQYVYKIAFIGVKFK